MALTLSYVTAGQPESVSTAPIRSASASGNSFAPLFGRDGRYLVFSSQAKNLTTNSDVSLNLNLFRKDLISGSIDLVSSGVSPSSGGGNDDSAFYSISSSGQFVAFASGASNLIAGDTNSAADIFIRNATTGTTLLGSVDLVTLGSPPDPSPTSATPVSSNPQISDNGRWVVFESRSRNLVSVSYDGSFSAFNVFARDLLSNTTALVSITTGGTAGSDSYSPRIDGSGRFVTFVSLASNLVDSATAPGEQLFLRDLQANTTTWVTKDLAKSLGSFSHDYQIAEHTISDDGQVIAYKVTDKATDPTGVPVRVFRYDTATASTLMLTSNSYPGTAPQLSRDGRFLAYEDQTNVLVWDQLLQTTITVDLEVTGSHPAAGSSHSPSISADGRFVAFLSDASDLVTNALSGKSQVFWRDLDSGTTRLVSANTNGVAANASHERIIPVINSDGSHVAFESSASDLVPGDLNKSSDIFVYDAAVGSVALVSQAHTARAAVTRPGSSGSNRNAANADASVIAYFGNPNYELPNQLNSWSDIFVHNLIDDSYQTMSLGTNSLFNAEISANSRYVTYTRRISTDVPSSYHDDVLRYDLVSGSNEFVNITSSGLPTSDSVTVHSTSSDGTKIAYQSLDSSAVYLHDFGSGSNTLISPPTASFDQSGRAPLFSTDDEKVFFFKSPPPPANGLPQLYLKLINQNTSARLVSHVPGGTESIAGAAKNVGLSGDSQTAAFSMISPGLTGPSIYRYQIASDSVSFICTPCQNGTLDHTGALLAYEYVNTNGSRSVYLRDLETGQTNLLSGPADLGLAPNAPVDAWAPVISSDARFILFLGRSATSATNVTRLYARDRALNQTLLLTPNPEGLGLVTGDGAQLQISRDSHTAIFRSFASDIVPGDYNDQRDVFVVHLGSGDSDGDGMDDDWEIAYFGSLARNGFSDFDHDGQSDLQEFRAGTDPTNQGSVLRALSVSRLGGGGTTVFWNAVPSRSYRVEFKDNVDDPGWTTVSGQVQTSGSTGWITDPGASPTHRFYRISLIR